MKRTRSWILLPVLLMLAFIPVVGKAQKADKKKHNGEFYFSWGYNTEKYTNSNIKISQPDLNNNYTFKSVRGHDHKGWNEGLFKVALSIPQYNYRLGYFFNDKKNLGVEINFDHTKFIFSDGPVRIQGTLNSKGIDSTINFTEASGFFYYLNNGANFLLFNIVKRWRRYVSRDEKIKIELLGKAGIGPVIPHVQNSFFGEKNTPKFQFGGWNTGVEGAARATFFKHVYFEFAGKLDYARYSNLKIYKGSAKHAFGTAEIILNLGVTL